MRVEIKTGGPVKDVDIKAIFIIDKGIKTSSERMIVANLNFVLGKYGLAVCKNPK